MLTTTGALTGSSVELNWLPPLHPNGAIHYEIEYEPAMTPGDPVIAGSSSSPYFTLTLPNEFMTYNVTVAAVNTQGSTRSTTLPVCPGITSETGEQLASRLNDLIVLKTAVCVWPCMGSFFTGPQPPAGVSVVVTGNDTAVVSWVNSMSRMCDIVIGNYSVRYRLRSGTGVSTTVNTSSTNVTLQDLVPNAEYTVSVAAINSIGNMSAFSPMVQFNVTLSSKSNMFNYYIINGMCMIL